MQVKNWMLATAVTIALASCGEAGSGSDNPDSTSTSKTTREETRTTRTVAVPEATRTSFEAKYPQASNVTWNYHEPAEIPAIDWDWTSWPTVDTNDVVARFSMD